MLSIGQIQPGVNHPDVDNLLKSADMRMIRRVAAWQSDVAEAGWGALRLGTQDFVHKGQQAIHSRLDRIEPPLERGARGGLSFVKLGYVL